MQLTELLFQKVKDLGAQGQLALKPGYVAIVSKAPSLRAALVAPICPQPDDQKKLMDGSGPSRVGVGLIGGDGAAYRLLRELGGSRQLHKFDPATKKFDVLTEDALEIDSFLRVECGMVHPDAYTGFFVFEVNELPSLRGKSAAAANEAYVDSARVKALKEELELTRRFEGMQDRLFKVQERLQELTRIKDKLTAAQGELAIVEGDIKRAPWKPEEIQELTARASRVKEDTKKRDDAMADIANRRQKALRNTPPPPEPFLSNPWFYGGMLLGTAIDALAFVLKLPFLAFAGLLPFLAALIAVLRFIHDDEADKSAAQLVTELKERETSTKRHFEEQMAPLKSAMRAAKVDSASELVELFKGHELIGKRRDEARSRVEKVRREPDFGRLDVEIPILTSEKQKLEDEVLKMGFSRAIGEIETDLKHAMGLGSKSGVVVSEAELPKSLIDRAAELLAVPLDELWQQMTPRFTAYLGALTDKRVASAKPDSNGQLLLTAPDGRTGPYPSLPPPLRDLVYTALRLTLLERVGQFKRLPVVVDDAFASLDPAKRALIGKMLKGIATQTQVIHRVSEAPPPGVADALITA